jgi:molybdenum cofactor cytidylyltransferase
MSIAVMILAAGQSSRLGSPKQLVSFNGKHLLQHSIDEAKAIRPAEIVVILGAHHNEIMDTLEEDAEVLIIQNNQWEEGMASSIRCGIQHMRTRAYEAVIIMVCDQPHVSRELLSGLRDRFHERKHQVVASVYQEIPGTPALFHRSVFEDLYQLRGDRGAKQLIQQYKETTAFVGFPDGITDIDTPEDLEALHRTKVNK